MDTRKLSLLKILTKEDLTRIHDASVKVLEETGMVFHSQKALAIFKKHGAKVADKTVYFSRKLIEDALAKCPSTFKWRARNDENSVIVGEGILVQPGGGSVYIQDLDNGRRKGKLEDFANIQKLYQSSDVVDMVGFTPVDTRDIDNDIKPLYMQYEILKNTDKPIHGHVCGGKRAGEMLDMAEIAFGEKDLMKNNHVMGLSINPLTPLGFAEEQVDTLIEYASRNQIILPAPLSIGGVSGPLSHVGMTVLVNAETLATLVLAQLVNPGNPILPAIGSTFAFMKRASYCTGTPDQMLHQITNIQLVRDLYHLPTRVNCGMCDSKVVDAQAGLETMQNIMMGILAGCNVVAHTLGVLDAIMTISYEKMIIDEEMLRRVKYLSRPIDVSDEALAVDEIKEVGPGGQYLMQPSTFAKCREGFVPTVSDWESYEDWAAQGSQDIAVRANKMFKERLANAPETLLDPGLDKELKNYMNMVLSK